LWVSVSSADNQSKANVVFEESPYGGDGSYLDPIIQRGKTLFRVVGSDKIHLLKMEEVKQGKKRWVSAILPKEDIQTVESTVKWGVYKYGKNFALLYYYTKYVANDGSGNEVGLSDKLDLDYKLKFEDGKVQLGLFWKGKPVANNRVLIRAPKSHQYINTDADGWATFQPKQAGLHMLRTILIQADEAGEFEGKKYDQIRRCATLTINLPTPLTTAGHTVDSLEMVAKNIKENKAILLDVRELSEWQAGHLEKAVLLPLSQLRGKIDEKTLNAKVSNKKIIYTHCRSGRRSVAAGEILRRYKYDVRPLKAGYVDLLEAGFKKAEN